MITEEELQKVRGDAFFKRRCYWHQTIIEGKHWLYTSICTRPIVEVWLSTGPTLIQPQWCDLHCLDGQEREELMLKNHFNRTLIRQNIVSKWDVRRVRSI